MIEARDCAVPPFGEIGLCRLAKNPDSVNAA